jgi:hypothetical protein
MAKTKISEFSATSADNTDITNINIAEGCSSANVNNAIRSLMSLLKNQQDGSSGDPFTVAGTLVSSGTVDITGGFKLDGSAGTSGQVLLSAGSATPTWGSAFVAGMIMMWSGTIATIPTGWLLCNGSSGTPDLRNRFIVGAYADDSGVAKAKIEQSIVTAGAFVIGTSYVIESVGTTDFTLIGSAANTVGTTFTASGAGTGTGTARTSDTIYTQTGGSKNAIVVSHTHTATSVVTDPGHTHTLTPIGNTTGGSSGRAVAGANNVSQAVTIASETTGITVATTINSTGSSGTNANLPPYYALCYIMKA